jgi:hypothetical protein
MGFFSSQRRYPGQGKRYAGQGASVSARELSFATVALIGTLGISTVPTTGMLGGVRSAEASVSLAVHFDDLVERADGAAVVIPQESYSTWEGSKIVTYTRVRVERPVTGLSSEPFWVKTLGGIVDKLGQSVAGEPVFVAEKSTLIFVKRIESTKVGKAAGAANMLVVERAQGQYRIEKDVKTGRLKLGTHVDAGVLLPAKAAAQASTPAPATTNTSSPNAPVRPSVRDLAKTDKLRSRFAGFLARDVLLFRDFEEALTDIREVWSRTHPPAAPTKL